MNVGGLGLLIVLLTPVALGQATFLLSNRIVGSVDAPVFVWDATEGRVPSSNYVAALFGGPAGTPERELRQQGAPLPFRSGSGAGYINTTGQDIVRAVAGTADGDLCAVQIRVWRGSCMSYEEAESIFSVAKSAVLTLRGGGGTHPPAALVGLASFVMPLSPPLPYSPTNPYWYWRQCEGLEEGADPDQDSLPNLWEYVLSTHPRTSNNVASFLPRMTLVTSGTERRAEIRLRAPSPPPKDVILELHSASHPMGPWSAAAMDVSTANPGTPQSEIRLTDRLPIGASEARFYRPALRLTPRP